MRDFSSSLPSNPLLLLLQVAGVLSIFGLLWASPKSAFKPLGQAVGIGAPQASFSGALFSESSPSESSFSESVLSRSTGERPIANFKGRRPLQIVVYGNSIASGFGVSKQAAFPARIQRKISEEGWNAQVKTIAQNGRTTGEGIEQIDSLLETQIDVLVLELGGNDALGGTPPSQTRENLSEIIGRVRQKNPKAWVMLMGVQVPTALKGEEASAQYKRTYPRVEKTHKRTELVPLILEKMPRPRSLMQADGIHPNEKGHRKISELLWRRLYPLLDLTFEEEPSQ